MSGYIDLHNHILHNIDDGPGTLNEAVMLARAMVAAGYDTVVATPHVSEGKPAPAVIKKRLLEIQKELFKEQIPLILLPGSEHHIDPLIADRLFDDDTLTINFSRYLLLELPFFQPLPPYTEELLFSLSVKGIRPVIPHPERVSAFQQDPALLHKMAASGAVYQLTWGALTGRLGPEPERITRYMVEANLAHLFATDAHNFAGRLMEVGNSVKVLEDMLGPGSSETYLISRPRAIIENKALDLPPASSSAQHPSKRFFFFKRSR
ncbi:MAG: tyrosine-protein phosphatase [Dethiobacteria bacterium]